MPRRSRAREVALQVLYQDDLNPSHSMSASDDFFALATESQQGAG